MGSQHKHQIPMTFFNALLELAHKTLGPFEEDRAPEDERRLAVAALLLLVARADGRLRGPDRARLAALFQFWFGLSPEDGKRMVARGDEIAQEGHNLASLVEMFGHDAPDAERRELLAMAYTVAAVDGAVQEFEDDLIWRVGQLLGLADGDILTVKDLTLRGAALPVA
jgi:uncharacterized tellurite resistance protein B-like protein